MLRLALAAGVLATIAALKIDVDLPADPTSAIVVALEPVESQRLANVRRWNNRVLTGGSPVGPGAFQELAELGVRTAVSVDGAQPDLAGARAAGIRYVHLPLGYGAVPEERVVALAKAVRDLPGPLYVHCHHGQHRAPVAAAIGCVGAGLLDPEQTGDRLEAAGTDRGYAALRKSALLAVPLPAAEIDACNEPFPESAEVQPLVAAMAEMDVYYSRLADAAGAGWPEANALAEDALLLRELATELLRARPLETHSEGYSELLKQVEKGAEKIRSQLLQGEPVGAALGTISAACVGCHGQYRDADH